MNGTETDMFAISSSGSNEYLFGMHDGHLNDKAAHVATLHGCRLVRYVDPRSGARRGMFATPNEGTPENEKKQRAVLAVVEAMGGFDALRMRYEEFMNLRA